MKTFSNKKSYFNNLSINLVFILFIILGFTLNAFSQTTVSYTVAGTANFTIPSCVYSITVECIGGGGAGGTRTSAGLCGGGGGGAYSKSVIAVTPGQVYSYTVGAAGTAAGGTAGSSTFGTGPLILAVGGTGVTNNNATGGARGLATACIGTIKWNGGNGATGSGTASGGGGSSGGAASAGNNGGTPSIFSPGAAVAPGGIGGVGRSTTSGAGVTPVSGSGGGGGGAYRTAAGSSAGGAGKPGMVRITYTASYPTAQPNTASVSGITYTTANLNWIIGNGDAGDIIFLKQGSAITTDPTSSTTYASNSAFGSGAQIGATGAFAVYSGFLGAVSISNLQPGTTYYYNIYTFDGAGPCYLTPTSLSGSFTTTSCSPTIPPTNLSISCVNETSMNLTFTRGNGNKVMVLARAGSAVNSNPVYSATYSANSVFGSGSQIGTGNFVVFDGNSLGTITVPITGLTAGITYFYSIYEYNTPPNCYNITSAPSISSTTLNPGLYISSTTTQNITNVTPGSLAQDIIKLTVVTGGGNNLAVTLNNIVFTTTGSTNALNDITNAKIFYTGNVNTFSNATQFGQTFTSFIGSLTASGNFTLLSGNNYFWIAYDVKSTATSGNVIDATIASINVSDNIGTSNQIPTTTAPVGSRPIAAPATLVFCGGVIPTATCAGSGCNFSCSQGENLSSINIAGATILNFSGWPCNATCGTNTNSYTDMFLLNKYSLNQGNTYSMSIVFSTWFSMEMDWTLWVDWNQDGVFTNAAPERFPASPTGFVNEWTAQNIIVPASVSSGRHRARLWMQEFSYPPTTPCRTTSGPLTTSIGQIVDFDIEIPDGSLPNIDPGVITAGVSCTTLAPLVVTPINYAFGAIPNQLTATGTNLLWYTTPTGGVGSATAPTPTTSSAGTQTYYVSQNNGSCEGPRIQISVNVFSPNLPTIPTLNITQPNCTIANGSIEFTSLPATGSWTINPDGISGTGTSYILSPVSPGTYNYNISNSAGCISVASVNAVVNTQPVTPSIPIVATVTQPSGAISTGSVELTGLPADGWTINPGNINGAAGVTSYTISGLSTGTYSFTVTNSSGCLSSGTDAIIIIGAPLPIELTNFEATFNGESIDLEWSTESEINNDYFTIEKCSDATNFKSFITLKGAGNSSSLLNYYSKDYYPFEGLSYYRLKQTDFNGKYTYSNNVSVYTNNKTTLDIISFNTETNNMCNAIILVGKNLNIKVEIINLTGKTVFYSEYNYPIENTIKLNINSTNFEKGMYFLKVSDKTDMKTKKIIIF